MKCRRCNRMLKSEPGRSQGIGPVCKMKEEAGIGKQTADDGDIIEPYDGGDIWIERMDAATMLVPGVTMNMKHSCSGIRTNIRRTIYRHSPTGFNFGYGGSGPADAALNILRMFTTPEIADANYQSFKFLYLTQQGERLVIQKSDILEFINKCK
jgi:hypothetical protein